MDCQSVNKYARYCQYVVESTQNFYFKDVHHYVVVIKRDRHTMLSKKDETKLNWNL